MERKLFISGVLVSNARFKVLISDILCQNLTCEVAIND